MTLRRRLLLFSLGQVLAVGLLPLVAGVSLRAKVGPVLDEQLRGRTEAAVLSLASRLDVALGSDEPSLARAALADLADDEDLVSAQVRNRDGGLVASVGAGTAAGIIPQRGAHAVDLGRSVGASVIIEIEGYRLGSATVVLSKARQRALVTWAMVLAIAMATICAVAIAIAVRFSRSFVAPIQRMIEFSHRVKEGGLSERIRSSPREGELSQLTADLNAMAEALEARDAALAQRSRELEESLAKLRHTQEELVRSIRLAAVGEMAGRTAHEVLNPMTGIHYRLTKMTKVEADAAGPNLDTLREIAGAWRTAYREGGMDELARSLAQPTGGGQPLVDEDLDNLEGIGASLADAHRERMADLQFLLKESDRVVRIVDGMRSLTRQTGTAIPARVEELVRESVETVADSAVQREVELTLDLTAARDAEVKVDRYEFVQILTNLLRNALLAIEEKSGRGGGRISVAAAAQADRIAVRVSDDGCGILDENIPFLFDASFTTRSSTDGTGLGLSIARRLARGFGGELRLERTRAGEGTTFLLELPVARPNDPISPPVDDLPAGPPGRPPTRPTGPDEMPHAP